MCRQKYLISSIVVVLLILVGVFPRIAFASSPTLTTNAATYLSPTGAIFNSTITDTGGETPSVRGFVYGPSTSYGTTTTDLGSTQVGAGKRNWNAVAMSPDGSKLVAATGGNGSSSDYLYASTDGGATWTALTAAGKRVWMSVGMSSDGTKLVAASTQYVFTSTDSGASWTQRTIFGSAHSFRAAAISPDGAILAAADNDGQNWNGTVLGKIYTSTDGGVTWTHETGAGTGYWSQLRFSPNGNKLIATAGDYYAYVYREEYNFLWIGSTSDGGTAWTWTRQDGAGQHNWISATFFSTDGAKVVAADRNTGTLYISTDAGATWNIDSSLGVHPWMSVAASLDGSSLALASYDGYLYTGTSTNGGTTWTWTQKSGTYNVPHWNAAALSSNGNKLVAAANYSNFYISPTPLQPISVGSFSATIIGLTCGTTYHLAAYATNASGTSYGPDTTFTTSACPTTPQPLFTIPATTNLGQDMIDEIDNRIAGFPTGASGFRSLWDTRGNGADGWQYNATTLWSNQGTRALDFTGASPWNSDSQYGGAGTLISPRHMLFAKHWTLAAGSTVAFVDYNNQIVTRTIVNTAGINSSDIAIGVLDSDVPSSIAYYPLLSYSDFQRYVVAARIPIIRLDRNDTVFIQDISSVSNTHIVTAPSFGSRVPYTASELVGGDSGNPNFAVIGDRLVLLGAHYSANSLPNIGNYFSEINAAMTTLGGGYQITQLDLSPFAQYVPPVIPNQTMSVVEQSAAGTVVGTVQVNGVNGMSNLQSYQITAGDANNAFSINSSTGVITVNQPDRIDFSLVRTFTLTISVSDSAPTPTIGTGTVTISVTYDPILPHPIVSVPGAFVWTERTSSGFLSWQNLSSSANGAELAAIEYGGFVWTSADSGATWTKQTPPGARAWFGVALSSDGTRLVAVDYDTRTIWTAISSNGGVTWAWTEQTVGPHTWTSAAISSGGSKIVVVSDVGAIFTSIDAGTTWTDRTIPGVHSWYAVASSADGSRLAAVDYTGYVYTSADAGVNWTDRTPAVNNRYWLSIASSADGAKIVLADGGGYLYTSTDSGITWATRTSAGNRSWYSVTSSADGTKLAAADTSGYLYVSADAGASWTAQAVPGIRSWAAIASSSSGGKLAAVPWGSNIWTGALAPSVTTFDPAYSLSSNATFSGSVDNIGLSSVTTRGFQYGLTTNYGTTTAENGSFGTGSFFAFLSGLSCGTTYHMRAYATSAVGTTFGGNRVFSLPCPVTLTYTSGANGSISGPSPQTVENGQDGTAVSAVPNAGFSFVNWSDGSTANPRADTNVSANISVTANFVSTIPPPGTGEGLDADVPLPPWTIGLLMLMLIGIALHRQAQSKIRIAKYPVNRLF